MSDDVYQLTQRHCTDFSALSRHFIDKLQ